MGKNAAGGAEEEEEDWNAIFNSPVGRRFWYHVKNRVNEVTLLGSSAACYVDGKSPHRGKLHQLRNYNHLFLK